MEYQLKITGEAIKKSTIWVLMIGILLMQQIFFTDFNFLRRIALVIVLTCTVQLERFSLVMLTHNSPKYLEWNLVSEIDTIFFH